MLRKYCIENPTTASHSTPMPTCVVMYGQRMSSPEPSAVARMMTLAPMIFLNGRGSGRSLYSTAGRYLVGSSVESCLPARSVASAMRHPLLRAGSTYGASLGPGPTNDGTGAGPPHPLGAASGGPRSEDARTGRG